MQKTTVFEGKILHRHYLRQTNTSSVPFVFAYYACQKFGVYIRPCHQKRFIVLI